LFAEALVRRLLVLSAVLMLSGVGCVERRMTIRSNPSNALVILDGQEIGFTPVSVPFHYYGVRQIKLVKDGYETKIINQHVTPPWYQRYGVDFVSEVLIPWRIRDERDYGLSENEYTLQPKVMVPQDPQSSAASAATRQGRRERIAAAASVRRNCSSGQCRRIGAAAERTVTPTPFLHGRSVAITVLASPTTNHADRRPA
jgi:hypothetical protein